jgi:AICAR transformylase/IMP cyclohydrolase PurH
MTLEERIQQRIEQLQAEREKIIIEANKTIAMYDASIAELMALLKKPEEQDQQSQEE